MSQNCFRAANQLLPLLMAASTVPACKVQLYLGLLPHHTPLKSMAPKKVLNFL